MIPTFQQFLAEDSEFVGHDKGDPRNKIYARLLKKGHLVGPDMYLLRRSQVPPDLRRQLAVPGRWPSRPQETDSFYLKDQADVTGNPHDTELILKDKRPTYRARAGQR